MVTLERKPKWRTGWKLESRRPGSLREGGRGEDHRPPDDLHGVHHRLPLVAGATPGVEVVEEVDGVVDGEADGEEAIMLVEMLADAHQPMMLEEDTIGTTLGSREARCAATGT
jgi:hypothetical protein